ncbi:protein AGENET DOMAIN (AGD)-CONTAINING P1-like [Lycium barbarum]|uniref:protein AGENET DOMAIN (AGD)-CONTAINING P1-like n=1 Tax=Lycium barbarum TaxID=112863 RepID=UPI00293F76D1|nr:protein AGENET DOMAIN (AGD)-CONTAINING P1-like [Lycium barbarum]
MAPLRAELKKQHSRMAFPKVNTSTTTTFKIKKAQIFEDMVFHRGDLVEVASKEDGFHGSYFEAIVMCPTLNKNKYIVQYKTLLKDDLSGPLKEVVTIPELRPVPPQIPANGFNFYDQVDAFDNDGWWVGIITGKIGTKYVVYFETFEVECVYDVSDLRVHQDWIDGKWISSKETAKSV